MTEQHDAIVTGAGIGGLTAAAVMAREGMRPLGLEHTLDQYTAARVALQTELPGLWMVGANTIFGHGIVGCMMSGRAAASMILQQSR